ncbi:hypothetical protein P152DRAFT_484557 [Eremomyces bilateralis CBS 781.70]|uniref:UDENN domain-containing protein n=1 Tax=Eremomyces bilateralis CBS 781.70 TaxID=1392243 RepID=A0A6G1FUG3_9PEZI|nr:uncharacterized protein P152DRAFT_484557 [Eremomyces bilateralis CBS 781.70]KAF1809447.1 hypothetical protein P152DRAFT_484557 [Eremomyces bilateralis CBS 781.70]
METPTAPFDPVVCVVDFHHARGPEVETWLGVQDGVDLAAENDWSLLPFMALTDGVHAAAEDYSYFTLRYTGPPNSSDAPVDKKDDEEGDEFKSIALDRPSGIAATSLFGISCTRQIDASQLINRPADVTRSTVQKAVIVIGGAHMPKHFGWLREKLGAVTRAWFEQRDFSDLEILKEFQDSLGKTFKDMEDEKDQYFGLSLRELIHQFKWQTLVLLKACLLQRKILFYGSNCEKLCMIQFSLISLIPGLLRSLQDCADPQFNSYEESLVMPTSLKTSERASLLAYMGLPLQIFGKGSLFGPYTPLQQLDVLADHGTTSYIVGSTNSLLLQQRDRYSDVLINLDENTIDISSPSLRSALALSTPDRRWVDFITQTVNDTWDDANPGRPNTMGYAGSEEFIRLQFEEYLLALLSAVKYRLYTEKNKDDPKALLNEYEGDPAQEFSNEFIKGWMETDNYRVFQKFTDSHLFDIVEPLHPCSGGLSIEDVQRRLAQQITELHLDERVQAGREVLGKHLATGQKKVSTALNNIWAEIEVMREAQKMRAEEQRAAAAVNSPTAGSPTSPSNAQRGGAGSRFSAIGKPDLSQAQASAQAAGAKAGAYLSSWGSWAAEKRRTAWSAYSGTGSQPPSRPSSQVPNTPPGTSWSLSSGTDSKRSSAAAGKENEVPDIKPVDVTKGPRESYQQVVLDVKADEKVPEAKPKGLQESDQKILLDGKADEMAPEAKPKETTEAS